VSTGCPSARSMLPVRAGPRTAFVAASAVLAILLTGPSPAAGATPTPLETKAEMLFNVAKFVQWPAGTRLRSGEMTFAILGDDELAAVIAATLSTRSIGGRRVFVRCVRRAQDARDCQVLYVAASEAARVREVLASLGGVAVLTTADLPGFAAGGGMVNFVEENAKIRFEINPGSAERARLRISARLLALARIVTADSTGREPRGPDVASGADH